MTKFDWRGNLQLWLALAALAVMIFLFTRCSAPRKLQGQKDYEARIERQQVLQEVRKQYPCDTGKLIQGKVIVSPRYVYNFQPGRNRIDTFVCATRVDTLPVYDNAQLQIVRDSVDNLSFLLDGAIKAHHDAEKDKESLQAQIDTLRPYKYKYIGCVVILSLGALFYVARVFKLI